MTTLTFYYAGVYLTDSCMDGKNVFGPAFASHSAHVPQAACAKCLILTLHILEMPKMSLYSDKLNTQPSTDKNLPTLMSLETHVTFSP